MNGRSSDPAGILIVRMWIEQGHPTALRARITRTLRKAKGECTVGVASSGEEICAIVRAWVLGFTASPHTAGDGHVTATEDSQPS